MRQVKFNLFQFHRDTVKVDFTHTFAYISLDAMIPQEADQTHIEYGFPVVKLCLYQSEFQTIFARCTRFVRSNCNLLSLSRAEKTEAETKEKFDTVEYNS